MPELVGAAHIRISSGKGAARRYEGRSEDSASVEGELELGKGKIFRIIWRASANALIQEIMGFCAKKGEYCEVQLTLMWVAGIDVWIVVVVICLTEKEREEVIIRSCTADMYALTCT